MDVQVIADGKTVETKLVKFSDGAMSLKIDVEQLKKSQRYICVSLGTHLGVSDTVQIIQMASSILERAFLFEPKIILNIPYYPHGRADRVFEEGMSCPLVDFTSNLSWVWHEVMTKDLHNEKPVESILGTRLTHEDQQQCFERTLQMNHKLKSIVESGVALCAPDKGAAKKADKIALEHTLNLVQMEKTRDVSTGNINGIRVVSGDPKGHVLIVDDICDGGMTFIKAAEELKKLGASKVSLYVTHGIFSKGLDVFKGVVDNIFCHQVVMTYVTQEDIQKFNGETK